MTVNRSIFGLIKSPWVLVFFSGFIAAFGGYLAYSIYSVPLKSQCVMPVSLYSITDDHNAVVTRGVYRTFRAGLNKGRVTFIGSISRYEDGKLSGKATPVQREILFDGSFSGNVLSTTVTGHHRRLGDQSSDSDVRTYIFPEIKNRDTGTTSLYLLDGKVVATGPETVPRFACIN
jgi:hypothetical protein